MNKKQMLLAFLCGMVLPLAALGIMTAGQSEPEEMVTQETAAQPVAKEETIAILDGQGVAEEMKLEEYLTGVVLSEMPADFHEEALMAQAVVARTYVARRMEKSKHDGAVVCMEPSCCQGYVSPEDYIAEGGSAGSVSKAAQAVRDTEGKVLTYEGELIDATYFSCSGGSTEAAVAVWGTDVPYLQSVSSPGEENAVHYSDQVSMTAEEFSALIDTDGDPEDWFGEVRYTQGGGVDTMEICGVEYRGTELRKLLGLRSTAFGIDVDGRTITISTRGFGHRVGMSQYGAQAMAEAGSGYEEILAYYYRGTELTEM